MGHIMVFSKAVLIVTFNRPETTAKVLEAVAAVRPRRLYVFSDGPRQGRPDDLQKISQVRDLFSNLNWEVELKVSFQEKNLGCAKGVSGAISWVLEQEEEVVILEDDCVPETSFFMFCEKMLDRFAGDERVFHISGTRWNAEYPINTSYFFSSIGHIWGWATWRRAWKHYDLDIRGWKNTLPRIRKVLRTRLNEQYWKEVFASIDNGSKHTWDYQWQHTLFFNEALAVVPAVNLVSNIGPEGTHFHGRKTRDFATYAHHAPTGIWKEDKAPDNVSQNISFDLYHMKKHFLRHWSLLKKVKKLVKHYVQR